MKEEYCRTLLPTAALKIVTKLLTMTDLLMGACNGKKMSSQREAWLSAVASYPMQWSVRHNGTVCLAFCFATLN